jgi:protein ImuA
VIAKPTQNTQNQTIVELRKRISAWERRSPQARTACVSTGCDAMDAIFPAQGIQQGSLVEWIADGDASGAETLSLLVGRRFCKADRPAILVDYQQQLYPVALSVCGFDLSTLIVIHPSSEREALWACEESLRCKAVALVWARVEHLTALAFRRLQLAAEETGGVGFLARSATALQQPSWADVRLLVTPRPGRNESPCFQTKVAYSRGKPLRSVADIEIDALRGTLHEVFNHKQTCRMSLVS